MLIYTNSLKGDFGGFRGFLVQNYPKINAIQLNPCMHNIIFEHVKEDTTLNSQTENKPRP